MKNSAKTIYVCEDCGTESISYSGKCLSCGNWNTLKEFKISSSRINQRDKSPAVRSKPEKLSDISNSESLRYSTSIGEFDRVLGGGLVKGSLILFAGEPGIGKSTLLSQIGGLNKNILYITAEESLAQVKNRFDRLKIKNPLLKIMAEGDLQEIIKTIESEKPELLIIDSIQTIYNPELPSTSGSIIQVKECAQTLNSLTKRLSLTTFLVGHVTKGGEVAGPRTLEHLVDVVLYLEGERYHDGRILRGIKNRFGPTDEVGIFKISEKGLIEVSDPSSLFLAERQSETSGNAVAVTLEGTRPILVEVQALTTPTNFGYPRRTASGYDLNRLNILIAILIRRSGINLANYDVYVNITGGMKISEPAIDLAVAMAIASAYKNKPLPADSCYFGEIGLSGEIRTVLKEDKRNKEAQKLGFKTIKENNIQKLVQKYL